MAISWSRLTLHGVQDHAGPTPMRIRHDALVAAADVVGGVRRLARELGGDLVTTVGNLTVQPNIVNAIPGTVTLSIDMRDPRSETLDVALATRPGEGRLRQRGRPIRARALLAKPYTPFPRTGWPQSSGAATPEVPPPHICPEPATTRSTWPPSDRGMIFVPSRDGGATARKSSHRWSIERRHQI